MLQNNLFPIYDKKEKTIVDGKMYKICKSCSKLFSDTNKKCIKHYQDLSRCDDGIYDCPYGLSSIVSDENIFTCLFAKDRANNKMKNNFEKEVKKEMRFFSEEINELIKYNIQTNTLIERYREATHDLRNMAANFNAMIDEFVLEKKDTEMSNCEMSMISLYELLNFRLDILSGKVDLTLIDEKEQKLHPMIKKISHVLYYTAKKKRIKINIFPNQRNWFAITKALYLSTFILLENAVKYSIPNTTINVSFEEDLSHTTIIMTNIADKIEDPDGSELLKRGVRGSNAKSLGSGMGLSLASELLEKMNATISVDIKNNSDNKSLFSVRITLQNVIRQDEE